MPDQTSKATQVQDDKNDRDFNVRDALPCIFGSLYSKTILLRNLEYNAHDVAVASMTILSRN